MGYPGTRSERVEYVRYGFSPRIRLAFCCRRCRPWSCRLARAARRPEPAGSDAGSAKASSKKAVELQVFAANSLEKALPEVQELYTEQTGTTFADTQFKASGDLVEQMRAGAAADVLITASKGTMDDAEAAELVDADTREDMFVNDLVIIRAEGSDTKIEAIADVANLDGKIAIGDAKTVPAGKYANQALASVGLYTGTEGDDGEYAPNSPTRWPWPIRSAPLRLTSLRATAWPVLSTAPTSSAMTASRRPSCAPRIRTSPSCIRVPLPRAPSTPTRQGVHRLRLTNKKAQKIWAKYGFELSA